MKIYGPYRKGKKAFKLGRKNRETSRYGLLLLRIEQRRKDAFKMAQLAIATIMGASELAIIRSKPIPKFGLEISITNDEAAFIKERSLAMINSVINTSRQLQSILLQP